MLGGATVTLITIAAAGGLGNADTVTGIGFVAMMGLGMFAAGALRIWAGLDVGGLRSMKSSRGSPMLPGHHPRTPTPAW